MGLVEKCRAYNLLEQRPDVDTFMANTLLGHHEDLRDFHGSGEVSITLPLQSEHCELSVALIIRSSC